MPSFPYDPVRDIAPIAYLGGPPNVLIVHPSVPTKNLKEFITYAKSRPGTLSFGSPGIGTNGHLAAEYFKQLSGIEINHVPYRGSNPALVDVVAGHIPIASMTLPVAGSQIQAGKTRPLALTSEKRVTGYPDVPTFVEEGYPDLVSLSWFSLSGPPDLPAEIVRKLNAETNRILQLPAVRERLRPEGFLEPSDMGPSALSALIAQELKRWAVVVRTSGARIEQ